MNGTVSSSKWFVGVCIAVMVAAAAAQSTLPCCRHNFEWPAVTQQPCSGTSTKVCETSSVSCGQSHPLCRYTVANTRPAKCCTYTLGQFATFVHDDCGANPPPGTLVGQLPDGSCCWIAGTFTVTCEDQQFNVKPCAGSRCGHD